MNFFKKVEEVTCNVNKLSNSMHSLPLKLYDSIFPSSKKCKEQKLLNLLSDKFMNSRHIFNFLLRKNFVLVFLFKSTINALA